MPHVTLDPGRRQRLRHPQDTGAVRVAPGRRRAGRSGGADVGREAVERCRGWGGRLSGESEGVKGKGRRLDQEGVCVKSRKEGRYFSRALRWERATMDTAKFLSREEIELMKAHVAGVSERGEIP